MKRIYSLLTVIIAVCMILTACSVPADKSDISTAVTNSTATHTVSAETTLSDDNPVTSRADDTSKDAPPIQDPNKITVADLSHKLFNGTDAYVVVNDGVPMFTDKEITTKSFESYAELDALGRCGVAFACVGKDLMPTSVREPISSVFPSGWKTNGKSNNHMYDFVDGTYVYNRCHLIGFQLTGENANEKNLITGTRYLNINGMLTFENMIADAVREDDLHVMYRVTPIYDGDNLLPEGVLMEGYSVEDKGDTIQFCMFAFNVQPGVEFNYKTGENWRADNKPDYDKSDSTTDNAVTYVLNIGSKKFHRADCPSAEKISDKNRKEMSCTRDELIASGYTPCGACKP